MKTNNKYGTTSAALVLADVVDEHPDSVKISRKVSRTINQFNSRSAYIEFCFLTSLSSMQRIAEMYRYSNIRDTNNHQFVRSSSIVLYELLVADYISRCDEIFCHKADNKVRSFVKNVIKSKYKAWLDGIQYI